ncbi:helix-turn-helix domain-containing protein [Streptomyces boncukensis]|uniref:Helix-turn-helix domain-containing protein n=1 Tax=Streptomyces boncukensis TaxID=2711219 RepID=A0A6G4WRL3_9ACTN|nr:helix-turn-helix transcriptional regulator [Streptomyces boncukensis]NGO67738.1 helix-turn-helix domain-containing protein [Streptomyces boncukensis]
MAAEPVRDTSVRRILDHPRGGPTILRIVLGTQLRRLREAHGISRERAGEAIRGSHAKISRLELGRVGCKERDVADLLTLYQVTDPAEREEYLALARQAGSPGWWQKYSDVMSPWFDRLIGLEEAAALIRTYEVQFVPGLLQTRDYARAVIRLGHPRAGEQEVERRTGLRMRRQDLLDRPQAPRLWAVVDEAALRRPLGSRAVMREQIEHLLKITQRPHVTLQVAPFRIGGLAAAGGPVTMLRFLEPDLPDVVYLEQLTSSLYLEKREEVESYMVVMDRLCATAEPPASTTAFLEDLLAECG